MLSLIDAEFSFRNNPSGVILFAVVNVPWFTSFRLFFIIFWKELVPLIFAFVHISFIPWTELMFFAKFITAAKLLLDCITTADLPGLYFLGRTETKFVHLPENQRGYFTCNQTQNWISDFRHNDSLFFIKELNPN